jgi:hypothetical protein
MKSTTTRITLLLAGAFALLSANQARAELVSWDVDSSQSYMRLAIPDQQLTLDGTTGTVRVRSQVGSNNAWNDTSGARAFIDGFLSTDLQDQTAITFNGGANSLVALNSGNYRPNPADFNPLNTNAENPDGQYSGSATAPAPMGAKVRVTAVLGGFLPVTVDLAYIAFRNVALDASSGIMPLTGGTTFAGGSNNFGIQSATLDVDGLTVTLLGQPIPDMVNSPLSNLTGLNTLGGSVQVLNALDRKLTLNINVPIAIDVDGTILNATATGQIVAFATLVPEPSSIVMAGFAAFGLCWAGRRRFRRA